MSGFEGWAVEDVVFVCILGWVGLYTPGRVGWVTSIKAGTALRFSKLATMTLLTYQ